MLTGRDLDSVAVRLARNHDKWGSAFLPKSTTEGIFVSYGCHGTEDGGAGGIRGRECALTNAHGSYADDAL